MTHHIARRVFRALALGLAVGLSSGALAPAATAFDLACITDSSVTNGVPMVIVSARCASYYDAPTVRYTTQKGQETPVVVQYMVHTPETLPAKGLVLLLVGGEGATGITGNPITHHALTGGNNFLSRSATLFALNGYYAVTIDRPSTSSSDEGTYDHYRLSARHAQDIVTIVNTVQARNGTNLPVFLVGTSRGTLSALAQYRLGIGSLLSSAITTADNAPNSLYIGEPGVGPLAAGHVRDTPVQVLYHTADLCAVSTPAGSTLLGAQFAANVPSSTVAISAGTDFDSTPADHCQALTFHGYFGAEVEAVSAITGAIDTILSGLDQAFGTFQRVALGTPAALTASVSEPACLDLATLVQSPADTSTLTFSLPFGESSRGATLKRHGSTVTYTPSATLGAGMVDGFVYTVSDGKHGTAAGVVTVSLSATGSGGSCS